MLLKLIWSNSLGFFSNMAVKTFEITHVVHICSPLWLYMWSIFVATVRRLLSSSNIMVTQIFNKSTATTCKITSLENHVVSADTWVEINPQGLSHWRLGNDVHQFLRQASAFTYQQVAVFVLTGMYCLGPWRIFVSLSSERCQLSKLKFSSFLHCHLDTRWQQKTTPLPCRIFKAPWNWEEL